ncbi:hypothetical protein ACR9E3_11810 [Actinomycetospora sp. C-140]
MIRSTAAVLGVVTAGVIAARTGVLARLGRRTTVRTVHPVR